MKNKALKLVVASIIAIAIGGVVSKKQLAKVEKQYIVVDDKEETQEDEA